MQSPIFLKTKWFTDIFPNPLKIVNNRLYSFEQLIGLQRNCVENTVSVCLTPFLWFLLLLASCMSVVRLSQLMSQY